MNPMTQVQEIAEALGKLNSETASRWWETQRSGFEAVVEAHRTRLAALQNATQVEDWVAAERSFYDTLNTQVMEGFKTSVELAQEHTSRLTDLFRTRADAAAA